MPQINVLSPHVADLIAAGEVLERPASAVKELLENSFDAHAANITVELRRGGRESIRITDDGCGMAPEDAGVCFLRHATSKLRDERGLEAIGTLGFRGEALAAVSAVSRISLTTRARGAAQGVQVEVTAGEIDSMTELGCPEGTTLLVRDIFFNTPARQKFLASDRAEGQSCVQTALRSALGRPEVSVRCIKDGEELFFSPGDGRMDSCIYALLGREAALGMLEVNGEGDNVAVRGFVSAPEHCRGNRGAQYFFCNGRPIRSKALTAALEQAYQHSAMVGRFPGCVLYITLPNGLVDVNVHPTKAEVRFAREKAVFDAVYYAALSALQGEDKLSVAEYVPKAAPAAIPTPPKSVSAPISAPVAPPSRAVSAPRQDFFRSMSAEEFRAEQKSVPAPPRETGTLRSPAVPYEAPFRPSAQPRRVEETPTAQQSMAPEFEEEPVRYIGEALGVYILLEQGDKLILIDKHAAHERSLYDKIRKTDQPLMAQELLTPATLEVGPEGVETAEANRETLEKLGFELETFGEGSLLLRAVPADVDPAAAPALAEELLEKLREGRSLSTEDVKARLAETIACKAAIKGGRASEKEELLLLAKRVLSGDLKYCPHGRPVAATFTRSELDKRFGRIQ